MRWLAPGSRPAACDRPLVAPQSREIRREPPPSLHRRFTCATDDLGDTQRGAPGDPARSKQEADDEPTHALLPRSRASRSLPPSRRRLQPAPPRRPVRPRSAIGAPIPAVLGLTQAQVMDLRQDGLSLAQIADAQNVDPQKLIDALVAQWTVRIDARVANGALTADRGDDAQGRSSAARRRRWSTGPPSAGCTARPSAPGRRDGGNGAGAARRRPGRQSVAATAPGTGTCDGTGRTGTAWPRSRPRGPIDRTVGPDQRVRPSPYAAVHGTHPRRRRRAAHPRGRPRLPRPRGPRGRDGGRRRARPRARGARARPDLVVLDVMLPRRPGSRSCASSAHGAAMRRSSC